MSTTTTAFPPQYPEYPQAPRRKSRWWVPLVIIAAAIIVLIGLFVGFIVFLSKAFSTPEITVKSDSILRLSGLVEEQGETPPFGGLLSDNAASVALYDAMEAIRYAQEDDNIQGIYIEGGELAIDNVKRQELRKALEDFKASGKFIYAFLEYGSKGDFFLASLADSIFMPLEGRLDLTGFGASSLFFKNTFDKLGVTYNVIQFEDFKSAGESFSRTGWSDSAKKSLRPILADAENIFVNTIASARKVEPAVVKGAMERFISSPDSLLALGLIDRICSRGEVQDLLRRKSRGSSTAEDIAEGFQDGLNSNDAQTASVTDSSASNNKESKSEKNAEQAEGNGEEEKANKKKLRFISLSRYVSSISPTTESENSDAIAVVYGSGAIVSGNGGSPDPFSGDSKMIASEAFIRELRKARDNENIKAIILRIDSPGGSVTASDAIWEEIKIARKVKPVYASMSSVAASGGYYMAMACEKIFAHPSTITGSIGVILMFPNFTGLLDKVGVTVDTVQQTPGAFFLDPTLPLNKQHQERLYVDAEQIYKRFVQRAADSRNMPYEQLRTFAKGRIWLGTDAQANGLVDYLGGLHEAIAYAEEQVGIKDAEVITYPKPEDPFEKFIQQYLQNDTDDEVLAASNKPSFLASILQAVGLAPAEAIRQAAPLLASMPQPIIRQLGYAYFLQQTASKERVLVALPSLPIFE